MIFHLKRATSKLDKQNRKIFKKSFSLQRIFDNSVKNSDEKENIFKRKALTHPFDFACTKKDCRISGSPIRITSL